MTWPSTLPRSSNTGPACFRRHMPAPAMTNHPALRASQRQSLAARGIVVQVSRPASTARQLAARGTGRGNWVNLGFHFKSKGAQAGASGHTAEKTDLANLLDQREPTEVTTLTWWAVAGSNRGPSACKADALTN